MKKQRFDSPLVTGKRVLPYALTFVIAIAVGLIMYKVKGIAPFGDRSVLCMDLWGQYFPMYVQNAKTDSFSELLYSWNGGFGFNNLAQSAYYCNSIFVFLMRFVPVGSMVSALNFFCLLKIGFSAVSCQVLLRYKLQRHSPITCAAAVSYGLCAYMLAFYSQCMWTDCLIYLPLVLIGLERLIHRKKPLMYALLLALTIFTNFYIGFAICIFSCLYFAANSVLLLHAQRSPESRVGFRLTGGKEFGGAIVRFGVFSLLGGLIAAFVIAPIGLAIQQTLAAEMSAPSSLQWYGNITEVLQNLLPARQLALQFDGVNIATSILVFLAVPVYFFNKKFRILERVASALLLVFLFASMNCNLLDFMWHGFHFPNQLPGRWTFMVSLVLVLLGAQGLVRIKGLTPIRALLGLAAGLACLYVTCDGLGNTAAVELEPQYIALLCAGALLILAASITSVLARRQPEGEHRQKTVRMVAAGCAMVFSVLLVLDSGSNFVLVSNFENNGLIVTDGPGYAATAQRLYEVGKQWECGEDEFYRTESYPGFTFNPSMIGDNNGMSYYSSTMQGGVFNMLRYLGNRVYAQRVSSVYNVSSPVQNSLFAVRYFLDTGRSLGNAVPNQNLIYEGDSNIWENPTVLPVAYAVSEDLLDWVITDEPRGIQNQNELLNLMCGRDAGVFQRMSTTQFSYENVTLQESENWNNNYFSVINNAPALFSYVYTCTKDGAVYLEQNFRAGEMNVSWSGGARSVDVGAEKFAYLGTFSAGDVITVSVSVSGVALGCCGLNMYYMDTNAWNEAYSQLNSQSLQVSSFKTTSITGEITMRSEGLVFSSIVQDGGWKVYCDGSPLETVKIGDTLLGVRVPAGTHTLEYRYHVPGFAAGCCISLLALLLAIWCGCPRLRRRLLRRGAGEVSGAAAVHRDSEEAQAPDETDEAESVVVKPVQPLPEAQVERPAEEIDKDIEI